MDNRHVLIERQTAETRVSVDLDLDGSGVWEGSSGLGILDHMLHLFAFHASIDLKIEAEGDLEVDDHHLVEDLGIGLGQALDRALGGKEGISRYGWVLLPMDEVLVAVAVDLSGRFSFTTNYRPARERVGTLSTEMIPHLFRSLACEARMTLHLQFLNEGDNEHHRLEALFKGLGRALNMAVRRADESLAIPSTKGLL